MRLLPAAALLALALVAPPADAASGPLVVSGRAGEVAYFTLTTTARLGNGGADTPVDAPGAPWAGVALRHLGKPASTYIHYDLRSALLCPGRKCEPPTGFQPTVALDDDGRGYAVLQPGRYGVALLGPAGTRVTATVRLRGARVGGALRTTRKAAAYVGRTFEPLAGGGVSRGFGRLTDTGRPFVDSLATAFVLDASAVAQYTLCATDGGRNDLDGNVGGVAPCADASGADYVFGPSADPVLVPSGQAVGIAFAGGAGRVAEGGTGLGYDAQAVGPASRISAVYVAVAF